MQRDFKKFSNLIGRQRDVSIGLVFFIIAVIIYFLSFSQAQGEADWSLSPGFFPRLSAVLIAALSILLAVIGWFSNGRESFHMDAIHWRSLGGILLTIAMTFIYVYAMEWLGFVLSTFITLYALMVFYGSRRWMLMAIISLALPLIVKYLAFKLMFVMFPAGSLFN